MINRSLIRIKTVQILYSYLLTRNDFKLETPPNPESLPSQDRRYAYTVYLDLMFLLLKLSGITLSRSSQAGITLKVDGRIKANRVGSSLFAHPLVKSLIAKNRNELSKFDAILAGLNAKIEDSSVFADYKKNKKPELFDDLSFWNTVFSTIIRRDSSLETILRKSADFTQSGFDLGLKMLLDTLASFEYSRSIYLNSRTALAKSLDRAYDLYHAILSIPVILTDMQAARLDNAKHKYVPTAEDLNPDTRFVDNLFVSKLRQCEALADYIGDNPDSDISNWRDADTLLSKLLEKIFASEIYTKYMESSATDYVADCNFWRDVMRSIVIPSDELSESLENQSVYWNDDINIMGTFALKTIKRATTLENKPMELLPKFMDDEDANFAIGLFEHVVGSHEEYKSYIDRFVDNKQWDTDRLAFMDLVVLYAAMAELLNYPAIPIAVTLNEYIEIANDYSTNKSGQFINGILYSVIKALTEEGKLSKSFATTDRNVKSKEN